MTREPKLSKFSEILSVGISENLLALGLLEFVKLLDFVGSLPVASHDGTSTSPTARRPPTIMSSRVLASSFGRFVSQLANELGSDASQHCEA